MDSSQQRRRINPVFEGKEADKEIVVDRPVRTKKDHSQDKKKQDILDRKRRNSFKRVLADLEEDDLEEELEDYR
jgi:hypothetical protein